MPEPSGPAQLLTHIRHAYPGGVVPGGDFPALLALLRQHLPDDDVIGVATELVVKGVSSLTGTDLRGSLGATVRDLVSSADLGRVIARLRDAGWNVGESPNPGAA